MSHHDEHVGFEPEIKPEAKRPPCLVCQDTGRVKVLDEPEPRPCPRGCLKRLEKEHADRS